MSIGFTAFVIQGAKISPYLLESCSLNISLKEDKYAATGLWENSAIMAKSENSILRFRGNILRFTTWDFEQFSYSTTVVSYSTILRFTLKIILKSFFDSTIVPILRFSRSLSDSTILPILRFSLKFSLRSFSDSTILPILRFSLKFNLKSFSDSPILPILRFFLKIFLRSFSDSTILPILRDFPLSSV